VSFVIGPDGRVQNVFESQFDPDAHVATACRVVGRERG
jgi:peroxiredoxin